MLKNFVIGLLLISVLMALGCSNISGTVTDQEGNGVEGVVMTLSGGEKQVTCLTDKNGFFEFTDVMAIPVKEQGAYVYTEAPAGSYIVTPAMEKMAFSPEREITVAGRKNINFKSDPDSYCPYKVYVILGFHANFYHSWRGDTNDEAGFGTDIRIVREILKMLDEANAQGLDARGYWEGEAMFTFGDIIPNHAPDIIEGIRRRVETGQDEIVLAPYSNTLFSATTEDEMRSVIRWAISNPWGSGAEDLFGSYVPFIRPQEAMTTTGQIPIMLEEGMEGFILPYSSYSFTSFSNFTPLMPPEQRYHFTRLQMQDDGQQMLLFPCVSVADTLNFISLEKWMLSLRDLQTSGQVEQDMVIHINFDADVETWIPMLPPALSWVPNAGGLPEQIKYVNKYNWSEFALPGEYLANHEPVGDVLIRQDTADGGWDGNFSWAEKYPSHTIWTELEKSRLYTYQAEALMDSAPLEQQELAQSLLYEGRDSSFYHRLKGLSTTHFGMSTPLINEERQAVAETVVADAKGQAEKALKILAENITLEIDEDPVPIYAFAIQDLRENKEVTGDEIFNLVRIPVIIEESSENLALIDKEGTPISFSQVNREVLNDGRLAVEIMVPLHLKAGERRHMLLYNTADLEASIPDTGSDSLVTLANERIQLVLDREHGVVSFSLDGVKIGGEDFLSHFITYQTGKNPESFYANGYELIDLTLERCNGLQRAGLRTLIPFMTHDGEATAEVEILFTLPDDAPWVIADVKVDYPYTMKRDILNTVQQQLRRYFDFGWIEVAPFNLHPNLEASRSDPVRVWKHNYLDVTAFYDLNYGQINPQNAELDSFNHQVTAGWVAVTDKKRGLLLAQSAEILSSYAFCSMRLRESDNFPLLPGNTDRKQSLWLNPFGSYFGQQMDYSHLGGTGVGADIADLLSSALRSNGPSYNGQKEYFSLLLAPYPGDRPPLQLQAEAESFFYPPAVLYLHAPNNAQAGIKEDMDSNVAFLKWEEARQIQGPLPVPLAFLANPSEDAVDLVWDEPGDARIDGYKIEWKPVEDAEWQTISIERERRFRIVDLTNGDNYAFRIRAFGMGQESEWSESLECEVGPVESPSFLSDFENLNPTQLIELVITTLIHLFTTP
jgi:hypothetical protein